MIPGSNLFRRASRLIKTQEIQYYQFGERRLNEVRQWIAEFSPPFSVKASVQAVPREKYMFMGLEYQKNYVTVFAQVNAIDIDRDTSGDQFVFEGVLYQLVTQTSWFRRDGWVECLAVEIGKGTVPITLPVTVQNGAPP
ncbi:putative structural protein [Xanthomonas phage FoX7]|uniref:Putative structural protein n=2 Tax=Carpasinavirus XcP1 TaxID=2182344 RepID=A0A858NQX3_9CAUD|nr:putative structural protein [Xanthomonas phage FoX6]QJB22172.1 putative structural protein [Xanthomonas phage FoX7]